MTPTPAPLASSSDTDSFSEFFGEAEPKLRAALVAAYGAELGRDAAAEALAYAWQHWDEVREMAHPLGYLYRVGQSRTRSLRRPAVLFPATASAALPWIEPKLPDALASLTESQRVAVVLAHGYGVTHAEISELMGVRRSTVQNHIERGLAKLRAGLEAPHA